MTWLPCGAGLSCGRKAKLDAKLRNMPLSVSQRHRTIATHSSFLGVEMIHWSLGVNPGSSKQSGSRLLLQETQRLSRDLGPLSRCSGSPRHFSSSSRGWGQREADTLSSCPRACAEEVGRDWGQEEKGTTEDEMAGWYHWLNGRESEWTPGVGDGQGGLTCCDSWGHKESDMTERLNWSIGRGLSTLRRNTSWNKKLSETELTPHCPQHLQRNS